MRRFVAEKRILLYMCICFIILSGCMSQTQKSVCDYLNTVSSKVCFQIPRVHTERPNQLDEGQWLANDDAASHVSINDKKALYVRRVVWFLFWADALLAGLAALLAYAASSIYHRSSCPTRGLSRMLAFIFHADGQKDNISFLYS